MEDAVEITNKTLDLLNDAYPSYLDRVQKHSVDLDSTKDNSL